MKCGAGKNQSCIVRHGDQCMAHLITDTPNCKSRVPITNADRIRAMTDEELADSRVGELVGIAPCSLWIAIDVPYKLVLSKEKAVQMELAWLQQPAKEDE